MSSEERQNRFKKMLEELESFPSQGFESKKVSDHNKALRATENIDELKDLEEERRAFVKALFEKNKN